MDMNAWEQYKYDTEHEIAQSLLQEEVDKQLRLREKVRIRSVSKKRIRASLFWGIPTLLFLLFYVTTEPLDRGFVGILLTMIPALIWAIRICMIGNRNAAKYLVREAVKSRGKTFSQIVKEDIQEQEKSFAASRLFHILLCAAMVAGVLATYVSDRQDETHVDGMVFRPYQDGYILVGCGMSARRQINVDTVIIMGKQE